jgi:hypothetical protein
MRSKKFIKPLDYCTSVGEYESSSYWRNKSATLLANHDLVCPICGRSRFVWQPRNKKFKRNLRFCVHHITYRNVPNEKSEDLLILCTTCHTFCHKVLQLQNIGLMYKDIADIVKSYFKYDRGLDQNPYFKISKSKKCKQKENSI